MRKVTEEWKCLAFEKKIGSVKFVLEAENDEGRKYFSQILKTLAPREELYSAS